MKRFLLFISLSLIFIVVEAQPPGTLQRISSTTGAACYTVKYYNNYVFAGAGNTVQVYGTNPTSGLIGNLITEQRLVSHVTDMRMYGTHLLVSANTDGVYLYKTSTLPGALTQLAHYLPDSTDEAAYNLAVKGDTLFVAYKRKMAAFLLDTSSSPSIQLLDRFGHLPSSQPVARVRGCDVKGGLLAYTVAGYSTSTQANAITGVHLVNAAATNFPQVYFYQQDYCDPEDVLFGKNTTLLHVLGGTESYAQGNNPEGIFYSLNVSNPSNPQLVFSDTIAEFGYSLAYFQISNAMKAENVNDTIYVAALGAPDTTNTPLNITGHTYLYDATSSAQVSLINAVYAGLWHFDVAINRKKMYVASEWYGIKTIDLTTLLSGGTDLGDTPTGGWNKGGDVHGNKMIQANEGYGMRLYDISSPATPVLLDTNRQEFCWGARFSGNGQYVFGFYYSADDFRVFDANTLQMTGSVDQFVLPVDPHRTRSWQHMAVTAAHVGLLDNLIIADASNPGAPQIPFTRAYADPIDIDVDTAGNLFVMRNDSITVYDLGNSTFPRVATIAVPPFTFQNNFASICVYKDTVYAVVMGTVAASGIYKYFFSGNSLSLAGGPYPLPVPANVDTVKYIAADSFGVYVVYQDFDLHALRHADMAPTGYYRHGRAFFRKSDYGPQDLYCRNGMLFLHEYFGQTSIFSNDTGFILSTAPQPAAWTTGIFVFPNPAQENVTVQLPGNPGAKKTVSLVNLLGQEIFREVLAGERVQVDVRGFAEGLYILRVESAGKIFTEKLVLGK